MNRNEVVTLLQLQGGMPLVGVEFLQHAKADYHINGSTNGEAGKTYIYKCLTIDPPAVGDLVVVETEWGLKTAKVVSKVGIDAVAESLLGRLKHVVGRIDLSRLDVVKQAEAKLMEQLALSEIHERLTKVHGLYGNVDAMVTPQLLGRTPVDAKRWSEDVSGLVISTIDNGEVPV